MDRRVTRALASARRFLIFLGYERSGHSLVGQIIDAHPQALVSHEAHIGKGYIEGLGRHGIVKAILDQQDHFESMDRVWSGYSYRLPGTWQGRTARPRVIGDKKGGDTTRLLEDHPTLIDDLAATMGLPVVVVHVRREPVDNIATMALRPNASIEHATRTWIRLNGLVEWARANAAWHDWIDVELDDLISQPAPTLDHLRNRLGLRRSRRWLRACTAAVWRQPSRTRDEVQWSDTALDMLAEHGLR